MKPANFPARRDARRDARQARAIERFSRPPLEPKEGVTAAMRSAMADCTALNRHPAPLTVRTKKYRGAGR